MEQLLNSFHWVKLPQRGNHDSCDLTDLLIKESGKNKQQYCGKNPHKMDLDEYPRTNCNYVNTISFLELYLNILLVLIT